jgi:hypothetical protein
MGHPWQQCLWTKRAGVIARTVFGQQSLIAHRLAAESLAWATVFERFTAFRYD